MGDAYAYAESRAESSTSSTSWQDKVSLVSGTDAEDYVVFVVCDYVDTSFYAKIQVTEDAVAITPTATHFNATKKYNTFGAVLKRTLTAASHTYKIQYATSNVGGTTYICNACILIVKASLFPNIYASNPSNFNTTSTSYENMTGASVSWTAVEGTPYLIIGSCSASNSGPNNSYWQLADAVDANNGESIQGAALTSHNSIFRVVTLPAGTATYKLRGKAAAGTATFATIWLIVLELPTGSYQYAENETSGTDIRATLSWTLPSGRDVYAIDDSETDTANVRDFKRGATTLSSGYYVDATMNGAEKTTSTGAELSYTTSGAGTITRSRILALDLTSLFEGEPPEPIARRALVDDYDAPQLLAEIMPSITHQSTIPPQCLLQLLPGTEVVRSSGTEISNFMIRVVDSDRTIRRMLGDFDLIWIWAHIQGKVECWPYRIENVAEVDQSDGRIIEISGRAEGCQVSYRGRVQDLPKTNVECSAGISSPTDGIMTLVPEIGSSLYVRNVGINVASKLEMRGTKVKAELDDYSAFASKYTDWAYWFCVPKGTPILCEHGIHKIDKIQVGHKVLQGNGRFGEVRQIFERPYKGILVNIKPYKLPPMRLTPEHPVYVREFPIGCADGTQGYKWVEAQNLDPKRHWLVFPRRRHLGRSYLDEERAELYGWYVAEGYTNKFVVRFYLGGTERKHAERILELLKSQFGVRGKLRTIPQKGHHDVLWVEVCGKKLADHFRRRCARHSWRKRVPKAVLGASPEACRAFLRALIAGDGYIDRRQGRVKIGTVSQRLVYDLISLCQRLGFIPTISKLKEAGDGVILGRKVKIRESYEVSFPEKLLREVSPRKKTGYKVYDNCCLLKIRKVSKQFYDGFVYNLATPDKTYTGSFIIHNCDGQCKNEHGQVNLHFEPFAQTLCPVELSVGRNLWWVSGRNVQGRVDYQIIDYGDWGSQADVVGQPDLGSIIDSYLETNKDTDQAMYSGSVVGVGQAFTATAEQIVGELRFYLKKVSLPAGNMTAKLYRASGTVGTDAVPTGTALATSIPISSSTLATSYGLVGFPLFDPELLALNEKYVATVEFSGGGASNYVHVGVDASAPTHSGNYCSLTGSTWTANSGRDTCFYLHKGSDMIGLSPDYNRRTYLGADQASTLADVFVRARAEASDYHIARILPNLDVQPNTRIIITSPDWETARIARCRRNTYKILEDDDGRISIISEIIISDLVDQAVAGITRTFTPTMGGYFDPAYFSTYFDLKK